jgi:hypothetical protein
MVDSHFSDIKRPHHPLHGKIYSWSNDSQRILSTCNHSTYMYHYQIVLIRVTTGVEFRSFRSILMTILRPLIYSIQANLWYYALRLLYAL